MTVYGAARLARDEVAGGRRQAIMTLARDFSIETTPKQATKIASFADLLPPSSKVFIAFIPGESIEAVTSLTGRLIRDGMTPVPHIAARSLQSRSMLERYVDGITGLGCRHALLLAGGVNVPQGPLTSSLDLLQSGHFDDGRFDGLFVAGHPDGNPDISEPALLEALRFKNEWSERSGVPLTITTQFSFNVEGVLRWAEWIGADGNRLPIRLGVAGPASLTSLLKYAKMCGVDASMTMLTKAGGRLFKLMGQSAPDGLIDRLAVERRGWARLIGALHYYPFGGLEKTARWASSVAAGAFSLEDEQGFDLAA